MNSGQAPCLTAATFWRLYDAIENARSLDDHARSSVRNELYCLLVYPAMRSGAVERFGGELGGEELAYNKLLEERADIALSMSRPSSSGSASRRPM